MKEEYNYYINRELSFLKFNKRVLEESDCADEPILERFKFIAIFGSNLDEFFAIRVGSLCEQSLLGGGGLRDNKTGWLPERQLKEIFKESKNLYREAGKLFANVKNLLKSKNINLCEYNKLEANEKKRLKNYFKREIMPLLSPQIIDAKHPFPHLADKMQYIILELERNNNKKAYGIIAIDKNINKIIELNNNELCELNEENVNDYKFKYILSEDLIYNNSKELFKHDKILSKFIVRVTRNADINAEELFYENFENFNQEIDEKNEVKQEDYRSYLNKILKKRGKLAPVRLEINVSELNINNSQKNKNKLKFNELKEYLCAKLNIKDEQVFAVEMPLDLSFIFKLYDKLNNIKFNFNLSLDDLFYKKAEHKYPNVILSNNKSVLTALEKNGDLFLHYPKNSFKSYLRLLDECVNDTDVISVKITLYRLSENSQIVDCLTRLAEAGKQVTVVVELNARFDEENNINWSRSLEEAGCNVIYGVEGYKIHSKVTLIVKKSNAGANYIAHFATGNYNEKTAKLYTDVGLITCDKEICEDALTFFNAVATGTKGAAYSRLLVAPTGLKSGIINLIKEQELLGNLGRIRLKMNSLTDKDIIDALVNASRANVKIDLIIRGICCVLPGIIGATENIKVRSIVGRFLEHSRIFMFGSNENNFKVYISSADLMTRNTTRRLEIAVPILDENIKSELENIFNLYLSDNSKAQELRPNGDYFRVNYNNILCDYINAQEILFL